MVFWGGNLKEQKANLKTTILLVWVPFFQVKELGPFLCHRLSLWRSLLWSSYIWPTIPITYSAENTDQKKMKENPILSILKEVNNQDERNMKDFPVFWDGSYLYQFLVAIWRSYKRLWLVGRKITVKGVSILVTMFVDKDQNIYIFFMGVWKSLQELYQLNIHDWQANVENS